MDVNEQYQNDLRVRQEALERELKEEEDALFKKFEAERRAAASEASKETELEWESKLKDIIAMWEKNSIDEREFERVRSAAIFSLFVPILTDLICTTNFQSISWLHRGIVTIIICRRCKTLHGKLQNRTFNETVRDLGKYYLGNRVSYHVGPTLERDRRRCVTCCRSLFLFCQRFVTVELLYSVVTCLLG